MVQETGVSDTIEMLVGAGYHRNRIQIFVLVNWKVTYDVCLKKISKLKEWGVKIDDCTWNTTKREMIPRHWTREQLAKFRKMARKHNQLITFDGYDPEWRKAEIEKMQGVFTYI